MPPMIIDVGETQDGQERCMANHRDQVRMPLGPPEAPPGTIPSLHHRRHAVMNRLLDAFEQTKGCSDGAEVELSVEDEQNRWTASWYVSIEKFSLSPPDWDDDAVVMSIMFYPGSSRVQNVKIASKNNPSQGPAGKLPENVLGDEEERYWNDEKAYLAMGVGHAPKASTRSSMMRL